MSKCDLHIHSRYSARSEEWLFRRFDFPDSYSDPKELYRQLLALGMDYVTLTDHDTIDGCLQILDLPQAFISEQITTYFPNSNTVISKASAIIFLSCSAICKRHKSLTL